MFYQQMWFKRFTVYTQGQEKQAVKQIAAEEETVENFWGQEGGAIKKIPKGEEETDIVPETFAQAPTERVEEVEDVENFPETTSPVARKAAAGKRFR